MMLENMDARTPLQERLLSVLQSGPYTRTQLVQIVKKPRTTVYDVLDPLVKAGIVVKYPIYIDDSLRGRPAVAFTHVDYARTHPPRLIHAEFDAILFPCDRDAFEAFVGHVIDRPVMAFNGKGRQGTWGGFLFQGTLLTLLGNKIIFRKSVSAMSIPDIRKKMQHEARALANALEAVHGLKIFNINIRSIRNRLKESGNPTSYVIHESMMQEQERK